MLVAQNPGGGAISAQEFATARQDLQNILRNPGYVPEQVAAINERVRVGEADVAQLQAAAHPRGHIVLRSTTVDGRHYSSLQQ